MPSIRILGLVMLDRSEEDTGRILIREGNLYHILKARAWSWMLSRQKAQANIETADDVNPQINNFWVLWRMVHYALTKCITPKYRSQIRFTILETEIIY